MVLCGGPFRHVGCCPPLAAERCFLMHFFWHGALQQVYLSLGQELKWEWTDPGGRPLRFRTLHLCARRSPDQGHPERECGMVPVQEAMFVGYMEEVTASFASQRDPPLVAYTRRVAACPALPSLLEILPRQSKLLLVASERTDGEHFFEVYRVDGEQEKLVSLTPLLAQILPWRLLDGSQRLLVPVPGDSQQAGAWLVQALTVRLWGTDASLSVFPYEVTSSGSPDRWRKRTWA